MPSTDPSQGRPDPSSRVDRHPHFPASCNLASTDHRPWHEAFAERCRTSPGQPAVLDTVDGSVLTYSAWGQRVARRRRSLQAAGVGPEVPVAVLLTHSLERLVTILAIVSAGGAYVPLDSGYPVQRRRLILEDTGAPLLIDDAISLWPNDTLPPPCHRLTLEALDGLCGATATPGDESIEAPPCVPPEATAYIIYTSGSTGRPRGVSIEHRALAWYCTACIDHYRLGPTDRLLQMATVSFDISVGEIFPCLAAGGTLQLLPEGPLSSEELLDLCRRWGTTVLFPATALWQEMARQVVARPASLPASLRLISFGGEKVSDKLLATWLDEIGDRVQLFNGYGPTEATVEATLHDVTAALGDTDPHATTCRVIGRPAAGVVCRVLTSGLEPVDVDDIGELCLDSPGLARGYLGQAAMTALKFVPDPFATAPGQRLYRTGDLVRQRPDRRLEILGRADQQVKIRGFRVEPGEIEAKLLEHPEVAEAHVVVGNPDEDELHLVAFVVAFVGTGDGAAATPAPDLDSATGILGVGGRSSTKSPASPLDDRLRHFLQRWLPHHHVPSRIVVLPRLPLNDNRKVDRFELARLAADCLRQRQTPDLGDGSPEQILAAIWRQVLRLPSVALDDDFFHLGGDSILAIRAVTRAHEQGLRLTPKDIFAQRTPRRLSSLLRHRQPDGDDVGPATGALAIGRPIAAGQTVEETAAAPLTPVQRWFFEEAQLANPHHFNQSMLLRVHDLDVPQLRRALDLLVRRHAALRLRFRRQGSTWLQQPVKPEAIPTVQTTDPSADDPSDDDSSANDPSGNDLRSLLRIFDLRQSPYDAATLSRRQPETWRRWCTAVQASLDFRHGPLLRCGLFDFGPRRSSRLLIAIHHLVVDGVTWSILLHDLEELYHSITEPQGPSGTSYRAWARRQQAFAQTPELAAELPFWLAQGEAVAPLPLDHVGVHRRRDNTLASTDTVTLHLDRRRTEELLRRLPAAYRTRINDVLLCAVAMALVEDDGSPSRPCLIDVEGHGREEIFPHTDLSRTAGWFTTTFPVRLQLPATALRRQVPGTSSQPEKQVPGTSSQPEKQVPGTYQTSGHDLGVSLKAIKEQLRRIPRQGFGFGCLYYSSQRPEVRRALRAMPRPEISFNYLGQLDTMLSQSRLFAPANESRGAEKCAHGLRPYVLEIDGGVVDGKLWINWHFSRNLHRRQTIASWAERCSAALVGLLDHCLDPANGGLTPSDVPLSRLDQGTLDLCFEDHRGIEDIYPLTSMQEGMLFHHQLAKDSRLYFEQSSWDLLGPLQVGHWYAAWQRLVDLHPALRTQFAWRGLQRPMQVVRSTVPLPCAEHDLRNLSSSRQETRLAELLEADRKDGFLLTEAPVCRIMVIRLDAQRYRFVWSYHHTVLDGWSIARLFDDAFALYADSAPPTTPAHGEDPAHREDPTHREDRAHREDLVHREDLTRTATLLQATPFSTYVAWLEGMQPADRQRDQAFWQSYLEDFRRPSLVGVDPSSQPRRQRFRGGKKSRRLRRTLGDSLHRALAAKARQLRCTTAVLVQGAWAWLLARHCDRRDVVFGSTVSSRPAELPGVEHIVGLLINTLPVRCRVDAEAPLDLWFQALQETLVELRQHQHHPLTEIQRQSPVPHDSPLFDHLLVFENYPTSIPMEASQRRGELQVDGFEGFDATNYTWTMGILPGPPLTLDVSFDPERLAPHQAQRLLGRFEHVLTGLAAEATKRLAQIPTLTAAERHQVLCEWAWGPPEVAALQGAGSRGAGPRGTADGGFLEQLVRQAKARPRALAVVSPGENLELTYGQLWQQATAWARRLLEDPSGEGPSPPTLGLREEPIGILLERRVERLVASLGVLLAGGVYVPLETTYPPASLEASCRVTGLRRLIGHHDLARRLLSADTRRRLRILPPTASVRDSSSAAGTADAPATATDLPLPVAAQLAYVLFTSGTSGRPKAVAVSHGSLGWYCQVARRSYGLQRTDRILHMAPVGFDFSVCEIFPALAAGAPLVLAQDDTTNSVRSLFDFCHRHGVSVVFPPTALWHLMVDEVVAAPTLLPPRLRLLASGGERLLRPKLERWRRAVGSMPRLMSGYGPTEVTVEASLVDLSSPAAMATAPGKASTPVSDAATSHATASDADGSPLGRPLPGVRAYVLGVDLAPRGPEQSGDIYLAGPGLARGYLGRPAATAASFLPDPFAPRPGGRLYRSGDVGYFANDGSLQILGRRDHQLKIRGHRIEPGAVEAALMRLPKVTSACVIGRRDDHGAAWLEAFVVPADAATDEDGPPLTLHPEITELRKQLAAVLPPHLIPSRIWQRLPTSEGEGLPKTAAGKIDRRRLEGLSAAEEAGLNGSRTPLRPLDNNERRLAALWGKLLEVEALHLHPKSNFFALGGHSFLATRLVQWLRQSYQLDVPLLDIFTHPTLAEMAHRLKELAGARRTIPAPRP